MGKDSVFSGGLDVILDAECTPPPAAIEIVKTATPDTYGYDMIGTFSITVTNPGPQDLTNVHVTDDVAVALDPDTNCVNDDNRRSGRRGVVHVFVHGRKPERHRVREHGDRHRNTEDWTGRDGDVVSHGQACLRHDGDDTATCQHDDDAGGARPRPATLPTETLPVTGVDSDRLEGFGLVGVGLVLAGVALLGGAAFIGRMRDES